MVKENRPVCWAAACPKIHKDHFCLFYFLSFLIPHVIPWEVTVEIKGFEELFKNRTNIYVLYFSAALHHEGMKTRNF